MSKRSTGRAKVADDKHYYATGRLKVFPALNAAAEARNNAAQSTVIPLFSSDVSAGRAGKGDSQPVTDEDIELLVSRDELANSSTRRQAGAVFNKWLTVRSDDPELAQEVTDLLDRIDAKTILKAGYVLAKVYGYTIITLGLEETGSDLAAEPKPNPKGPNGGLGYIRALSKKLVKKINEDTDITSDTFGSVLTYELEIPAGDKTAKFTVNGKRAIHWINPDLTDPSCLEGQSMFEPLYDKYLQKRDMDSSIGRTIHRCANPWPTLDVPMDADEVEVDDAEKNFANINARSWFIVPPGYKFDIKGTNVALNPQPYLDYMLTTLSAGQMGSKVAMLGTEAGAVTGSEININEKYAMFADEQTNFVEPIVKELIKRCQGWGILREGKVWLEWNTLWEMDEKETAAIELQKAQAFQAFALGLTTMKAQGFEPTLEDGEIVFTLNGEPANVPGVNSLPTRKRLANNRRHGLKAGRFKGLVKWAVNARAPGLSDTARGKLFKESEVPTQDIENRMIAGIKAHLAAMRTEFFAALKKSWEKNIGPIDLDPTAPAPKPAKQDAGTLQQDMNAWSPSDVEAFRRDITAFLLEAYRIGDYKALQDLGVDIPSGKFDPADKAAVAKIQAEGERLATNTYLDSNKAALNAIADSVNAGESYAQIADRLATQFSEYDKGIPNTVQKFVHTAAIEARFDELEAHGADKVVFLTSRDELVRDTHRAMDGQIVTRAEGMRYFQEFGCRCTPIPFTAYDRALAEEAAAQEEASSLGGNNP